MANVSMIQGFKPVAYKSGAPYNGACRMYYKSASDGALYVGDAVIRKTGSTDPNGAHEAIIATVGAAITGVVVGVLADPKRPFQQNYLASGDVGYLLVADDPNLLFEVQEGGSGTALAITDVGTNLNTASSPVPSTYTGYSGMVIDNNTKSAGNTWSLWGLVNRPNNALGASAKWLVSASLHTEVNASAQNITNI